MDGRPLGYHLLIEQPNRAFLERNKIQPGGDMYKLLWFGRDIVGKHEKKNNPETGHDALVQLIEGLDKTQGDEQWALIKKNFNVERVINYFAVNACLTHWDGFFNNYFTYHDTKGTGKWEMYPWDQDKTWGFHDSLRDDQIFWDMPLKYAQTGDEPPGRAGGRQVQGFNVGHWWRPPGYFSGPLLANPHFRKHYVARTREILETVYTREVFFPMIEDLGKRLKKEVELRAQIIGEDPKAASARLETNLELLRDHLTKRREFLLKEEEIRVAGKFSRTGLN
jgi:spore coat protein CotH